MTCAIEEFPLLPFEPVPRGETLAHWRNEIAEWAGSIQGALCEDDVPAVDLTEINLTLAEVQQTLEDFVNRLVPYPYTALGIVYAPTTTTLGQLAIGSANQVLGINAAGTTYEYKTVAGTVNQIGVTHGVGTITLTLLAHAASHMSAGSDPIRIDELKIGTDVTTLNATATEHGLLRKLSGVATEFLDGTGAWSTPATLTPGTVNYLPKWTAGAPYLSATSLVYDNGTNVGINVGASPLATLHVASNTAAGVTGTNIQLRLTDTTNTARSLLLGWDQANAAGYIQATVVGSSADTLQLNPGGGNVTVGAGGLKLDASATFQWGTDVKWLRGGAGITHVRNGANAQVLYVFNTYTDAVNYEGLYMGWSSNVAYVYTETVGSGAARELRLGTYGNIGVSFLTNNVVRWQVNGTGHLVLGLDITYNIGAAAQRVNDVYIGGNLYFSGVAAGYLKGNGAAAVSSVASIPVGDISGTLLVTQGGTGAATLTGILQGNGTSAVTGINGTADVLPKWSATAPYLADSLLRSGTNLVEQYNSTNAQTWALYGTRTDGSNYERLTIKHNGSASGLVFTSGAAGSGTARDWVFTGGSNFFIGAHTLPLLNATYDLGSDARRWSNLYIDSNIFMGSNPLNMLLTRTIPTTVGDYVEIGNFVLTNGAHNVRVSITVSDNSFAVAKTYIIVVQFNETAGNWRVVAPIASTGSYSGAQDFDLEAMVSSNTLNLRIVRTVGTTAGTAYVRVEGALGRPTDVFTATSATGTGAASSYLGCAIISQIDTNVGIGTQSFGASMAGGISFKNGTAPTGNVTDCFMHYAADQAAGNSAPHWRSENGAVYRLFQSTGWTLPTGTASKAGYATSTATLTQVAETLKAVMDHLMTGCALFAA